MALDARPEEGEGIVTGDVVNTASRLQGAAPVNGDRRLRADVSADGARVRLRGARAGAGEGQDGAARALAAASARARGFGADVTRTHTTPLVGRELEKTLLIGTFERSAQQRSCQLVTIVGEPGVGKSRLCTELLPAHRRAPGARDAGARAAACPTARGSPSGRSGRSSRPSAASSSRTRPWRPRPSSSGAAGRQDRAWLKARLAPLVGVTRRAGLAGGVVHGLAALPGGAGGHRPDGARLRGSALGR